VSLFILTRKSPDAMEIVAPMNCDSVPAGPIEGDRHVGG
jgi:hypothetical protein